MKPYFLIRTIAGALAFVSFCETRALAMNAPSASSGSQPAPQYIEAPQPTTTTVTSYYSGPSFYSGGSYTHGYYGGGYDYYSVYSYRPNRYFFPPIPPALGEPYLRNRTKSASLVRSTIPLSLSAYVADPFYAPLSPFLFDESVSKKRLKTLNDYESAKQALIRDLRAKLTSLENADVPTREAQLAEFSREQTPRAIAIEKMAYDIRDDLTHWAFFASTSDWNEGREWRLGDDTRWESTLDEAKAMRGYAFFQNGLSPAQRRLLLELAMKLDDSGREPTADIALTSRGPYFYFSPETSRIRLPAAMPPELAAKIAAYRGQKDALEKELRDVIYHNDRAFFGSTRVNAFRELAEKQAGSIAALEPLAEDIRRGLALLPSPSRPTMPSLTNDLTKRVDAYLKRITDFQQTLTGHVNDLKRQFPNSRVEFIRMSGGIGIQLVASRRLRGEDQSRFEQAQTQVAAFNAEQIATYGALAAEKQAIRQALVESAGPLSPLITPRTVDFILRDLTTSLSEQELWHRYHEYEVAVLEPGLSPELRRLLYGAALVSLDLQLPNYTY